MSAAQTIHDTGAVCRLDQLSPERGAAVLIGERQVALFRIDDAHGPTVYALDHRDPFTGANVLARGIVGTSGDRWYVASPLHKQRFDLATGECLDDNTVRVDVHPVGVVDGHVHVDA